MTMVRTDPAEFIVGQDDLALLEIRDSGNHVFHYFFYRRGSRLIKQFVLDQRPRVTTLCEVTLIRKAGKFTPRLRIWKRDESEKKAATAKVGDEKAYKSIKAGVSLDECHETFWTLINFLLSFRDFDIPRSSFAVVETADWSFVQKVLTSFRTPEVQELLISAKKDDVNNLFAAVRQAKNKQALKELRTLIEENVTELRFQEWFQENTWAFGIEYLKIYDTSKIGIHSDSDFVAQSLDSYHDLIELKRPSTELLRFDSSHRDFYPSVDLSKAIGQAVDYLYAMERSRNELEEADQITVLKPRIKIIAGLTTDYTPNQKRALRLIKNGLHGMEIISYDQVVARAQKLIDIFSTR
jgi:hypothetical protein